MKIAILGLGCAKCKKLFENTKAAVKELGIQAQIVKIENPAEIVNYGVMMMPALVVDGQVKLAGQVASKDKIKEIISGGEIK